MVIRTVFLRYPGFKQKAVTFSYDDDVVFNFRLKELFDKYGAKATFNLNGGQFAEKESNGRMATLADTVRILGDGKHEIALHGYYHKSLALLDAATGLYDILNDRAALETAFGRIINGMAYANGSINNKVVDNLRSNGIKYARTVKSTYDYHYPEDWLLWNPTCHHNDPKVFELINNYLNLKQRPPYAVPLVFYMWGHSYEFEDRNNWDRMEEILKKFAEGKDDLFFATNGFLYDYVTGFKRLELSIDNTIIYNPTSTDYYIEADYKNYLLKSGETLKIY